MTKTSEFRDYLEQAAEARRRGDLGAADAAETLALVALRAALVIPDAQPAQAVTR